MYRKTAAAWCLVAVLLVSLGLLAASARRDRDLWRRRPQVVVLGDAGADEDGGGRSRAHGLEAEGWRRRRTRRLGQRAPVKKQPPSPNPHGATSMFMPAPPPPPIYY